MTVKEAMQEIEAAEKLAKFLDTTAEGVLNEYESNRYERAAQMLQMYAAMIKDMKVMDG